MINGTPNDDKLNRPARGYTSESMVGDGGSDKLVPPYQGHAASVGTNALLDR